MEKRTLLLATVYIGTDEDETNLKDPLKKYLESILKDSSVKFEILIVKQDTRSDVRIQYDQIIL